MRFTCDGCGKRYATADEPVPGRVYKLTCKRCGHVIVLRVPAAVVGPAATAPRASPSVAAADAVPAAATPAPMVSPALVTSAVVPPPPAVALEVAPPVPTAPAAAKTPAAVAPAAPEPEAAPPLDLDGVLGAAPGVEGEAPRPAPPPAPAPEPVAPPAAAATQLELPPLLPDETDEPTIVMPAMAQGAAPEAEASRGRFELSRMSRPRRGLPLPVVLVALLIVVAVVVALIRADRPRQPHAPPAPSTAAAPAR